MKKPIALSAKYFVLGYIILSLAYIILDFWNGFKLTVMRQSYINGQLNAYQEVISESNKGCQGFTVRTNAAETQLINLSCLQPNNNTPNTTEPTEPNTEATQEMNTDETSPAPKQ